MMMSHQKVKVSPDTSRIDNSLLGDTEQSSTSKPSDSAMTLAKAKTSKRPFRETDTTNQPPEEYSRLKRIRQIQTFSIDHDDETGGDTRQTFIESSDTFDFENDKEFQAIVERTKQASSVLGYSSPNTTTLPTTKPCLLFAVGGTQSYGNDRSTAVTVATASASSPESPPRLYSTTKPKLPQSVFRMLTSPLDGTLKPQSSPFPEAVLITPNDDSDSPKSTAIAEKKSWDTEILYMVDSKGGNLENTSEMATMAAVTSLRPKPAPMLLYNLSNEDNIGPAVKLEDEQYTPRLYGLPLPEYMKPLLRILLVLEEEYTHRDPEMVRDVFAVVQSCFDKRCSTTCGGEADDEEEAGAGHENKKSCKCDIKGDCLESIVDIFGDRVDFFPIIRKAFSLEEMDLNIALSTRLNVYFDTAHNTTDGDDSSDTFIPTLL